MDQNNLPGRSETEQPAPVRFLRLKGVLARTGISRSQVYRLESEGRFPRRVKLGSISVAWVESEVEAWCRDRIRARTRTIP